MTDRMTLTRFISLLKDIDFKYCDDEFFNAKQKLCCPVGMLVYEYFENKRDTHILCNHINNASLKIDGFFSEKVAGMLGYYIGQSPAYMTGLDRGTTGHEPRPNEWCGDDLTEYINGYVDGQGIRTYFNTFDS